MTIITDEMRRAALAESPTPLPPKEPDPKGYVPIHLPQTTTFEAHNGRPLNLDGGNRSQCPLSAIGVRSRRASHARVGVAGEAFAVSQSFFIM
jgi:hypothetical protein